MIDLYYWPTPNGHKITIFLEEAGIPYTIHPVNISAGDQFKPDFLKIAPNNRMPAIIDRAPQDGGAAISVFESGAQRESIPIRDRLLQIDRRAPVLRLLHTVVGFDDEFVLALAAGGDAAGRNAEPDKLSPHRVGAPF